MIYNRKGAKFEYDGVEYTVGGRVKGTEASEYAGLYGRILEIRTEHDRETENDTPDIYCSFDPPTLPQEIRKLEEIFSDLYDQPKTLDEITLDLVIMAPDMIAPIQEPGEHQPTGTLYLVMSHWMVDGEGGVNADIVTSLQDAKLKFHDDLVEETENGCIERWKDKESFVLEATDRCYEAYLDGEYCENHYCIEIQERNVPVSQEFLGMVLHRAGIDK